MTEVQGDRVFAIYKADETTVTAFGYGTHIGSPENPFLERPNPCIVLDNGYVIWGYQCYWGNVDGLEEWLGDRELVDVPDEWYAEKNISTEIPELP